MSDDDIPGVLTAVGPRLRALRQERGTTLAALSETTGISVSTLSRLESGKRKPTLELLLPLPLLAHITQGKSTCLAQGDNPGRVLGASTHTALLVPAMQQSVQRRSGTSIPPTYALGRVKLMP
jgi:DNA-binding XRE family transcriptional regulator